MTRRIVITGSEGFLGWHLRCHLLAVNTDDVVCLGHQGLADPRLSAAALAGADVVIHLAGVNRGPDDLVSAGNPDAAHQLIAACEATGATPDVVFADSIQSERDTVYGRSKRQAAGLLADWTDLRGQVFTDVRLPNLFGEHGRPFYNSVVATFCYLFATGDIPEVTVDAELPLLHAQRAAAVLVDASLATTSGVSTVAGKPVTITTLKDLLSAQSSCYSRGELPDLSDAFQRDMFNAYRSYTFPDSFPIPVVSHSDHRGSLFECVRAHGGQGQTFLSTSRPGVTRGDHFHINKVERFVVVAGRGRIRLRKLFTHDVVTFDVSGESPQIVDMPTMWAHSLANTGSDELLTLFWADQLFDTERPDTYAEPVLQEVSVA